MTCIDIHGPQSINVKPYCHSGHLWYHYKKEKAQKAFSSDHLYKSDIHKTFHRTPPTKNNVHYYSFYVNLKNMKVILYICKTFKEPRKVTMGGKTVMCMCSRQHNVEVYLEARKTLWFMRYASNFNLSDHVSFRSPILIIHPGCPPLATRDNNGALLDKILDTVVYTLLVYSFLIRCGLLYL